MAKTKIITCTAANPNSALWRIVLSNFEQAEAEYQAELAKSQEADAAYFAEIGEENPDFKKYGLGCFYTKATRDELIHKTQGFIAAIDYEGVRIGAQHWGAIAEKAATLVDERLAFKEKSDEAYARIVEASEKPYEEALDKLWNAREVMLKTPAPDAAALLYKLHVLANEMREARVEDAERVTHICDDAEQLFGSK